MLDLNSLLIVLPILTNQKEGWDNDISPRAFNSVLGYFMSQSLFNKGAIKTLERFIECIYNFFADLELFNNLFNFEFTLKALGLFGGI